MTPAEALAKLAKHLGSDTARRLVQLFLDRALPLLGEIEAAAAARDAKALRHAAHELVTNAGTLGFLELAAAARAIEQAAASGRQVEAQEQLDSLRTLTEASMAALRARDPHG